MEKLDEHFIFIQFLIIFGIIVFLYFKRTANKSLFKKREADRKKSIQTQYQTKEDYEAQEPLELSGISITGLPHEILGVPQNATKGEIHEAYLKLMKQYHPDKVASPDDPQWQEAQNIARAINDAKNKMLKK